MCAAFLAVQGYRRRRASHNSGARPTAKSSQAGGSGITGVGVRVAAGVAVGVGVARAVGVPVLVGTEVADADAVAVAA